MSNNRFKYLFQQYVNRTATSEETEEFRSMLKQDNHGEELQQLLDELWDTPFSIKPLNKAKKEHIFNEIMTSQQYGKPILSHRIRKKGWSKLAALAAAVIIIGCSILLYQVRFQAFNNPVKENNNKLVQSNTTGCHFINLPDGSSVILNQNSKIEISEKFNTDSTRQVYLIEGEAYFDVKHDPSRPFIVHTGKLQTTVLGTSFNINANLGKRTVTVTVTRGKVKVGDDTHIFNVIDPDEQVVFQEDFAQPVKKAINAEKVVAWKNEDIYFDDVNIQDVANQLQERFRVSIVFANEMIKNCRFSATFLKSQSLEQILNIIGEFNHIEYEFIDKNTVVLDGKGCN